MKQNYDFKIDKIKDLTSEEISLRKKNLDLFYQTGFPNKKDEDWKFSDLNSILSNNFNKIVNNDVLIRESEFKMIDELEHNFISLFRVVSELDVLQSLTLLHFFLKILISKASALTSLDKNFITNLIDSSFF